MKVQATYNRDHSVLNTDAFDRRRFKEIFELSPGLKRIMKESTLPLFNALLADIWASLYKMKPEIMPTELGKVSLVNQQLMKRIMLDKSYVRLRAFTRLNDLMSAIGTIKLGTAVQEWFNEISEENKVFCKLLEKIEGIEMEFQQQGMLEEEGITNHLTETDLSEALANLNHELQQHQIENCHGFSKKLARVTEETKQMQADLQSLLGDGRGNADRQLKKVPLRDLLSLTEKISTHKKMKEIAQWAGKFKRITQKKEKGLSEERIEKSGVTLGNTIEKLLPFEFSLYMHPLTRKDFLCRFIEGQTMQYEEKSTESLGKGPIILCLDQSGSMYNLDTQSKGFIFALLFIARKEKRDFHLVLFSTEIEVHTYKKGAMKAADIIDLTQAFLGGGTNFKLPLIEALHAVNGSRFKKADVLFMTDGEAEIDAATLAFFNQQKKKKDCSVLSIVMGNHFETVKLFSDRVIQVEEFNEEGSFTAFDIYKST